MVGWYGWLSRPVHFYIITHKSRLNLFISISVVTDEARNASLASCKVHGSGDTRSNVPSFAGYVLDCVPNYWPMSDDGFSIHIKEGAKPSCADEIVGLGDGWAGQSLLD